MRTLINSQLEKGNLVEFAENDKDILAVLNQEDPENKYIHVYDARRSSFVRMKELKEQAEKAFAIDAGARLLAWIEGENLVVKLIRIPNSAVLADVLRPRFNLAKMKLNPVTSCENRQAYKDKIYNMLHAYHFFKDFPDRAERETGMTEQQNI